MESWSLCPSSVSTTFQSYTLGGHAHGEARNALNRDQTVSVTRTRAEVGLGLNHVPELLLGGQATCLPIHGKARNALNRDQAVSLGQGTTFGFNHVNQTRQMERKSPPKGIYMNLHCNTMM